MGRHMREGIRNLVRNGWMTFASISSVAITLLILGMSLVIAFNAQQMSKYVAGQLEIDAYLQTSVTDAQGQQIASDVRSLPGVKSVTFVSKEEGWQTLKQDLGQGSGSVLDNFSGSNTLPVRLIVHAIDAHQQHAIATEVKALPGVDKVDDGQQVVDRLFSFLNAIRNVGLVLVVALIITATFLISNTIKITIFSRRREIEIMKLVGATNWFIRWPFIWEGLLIGGFGALIPYAVLWYSYASIFRYTGGAFIALAFPLMPTTTVAENLAVVMFGLGLLIGAWGGAMSLRRFLRI